MVIIIGKQNQYTSTFDTVAKTLVINGLLNYNINLQSAAAPGAIVSIYDVTASKPIPIDPTAAIVKTFDPTTGLQIFTITFGVLPSGVANGDTLIIKLNVSYQFAIYSLAQYAKA